MFNEAIKQLRTAFILLILFTVLTGLIYPGVVTVFAQLLFPWQANGSMIKINDKIVGSELIGQSFTDAKYFWGRPSATSPYPYNAENSSGSNLGPSNPSFLTSVKDRVATLQKADTKNDLMIPVDLVTASGSGLDPDISLDAAMYQVNRIATVRNIPADTIQKLIMDNAQDRTFNLLGEPRVNVLKLNLALDNLPKLKEH